MPSSSVSTPQLRLLFVNADEEDTQCLLAYFQCVEIPPQIDRPANIDQLQVTLLTQVWDAVIFFKHRSPKITITATCKAIQRHEFDLPLIIITDNTESRASTRPSSNRVYSQFVRDSLDQLIPTIERERTDARHRADHRAALEMLKESEARFRALASNIPGMVFELQQDARGVLRFEYVSEGCDKLFGLKQHELRASARHFIESIEMPDRATLERTLEESATSLTTLNWEGRTRKRGKMKWINLRSTPRRINNHIQWQGIATDITRSKEAEAQLRRSREQLSELSYHLESAKEEERERIARDIHDELGSTLVAIKIETALLASKLPSGSIKLRDKAHAIDVLIDRAMNTASRVARELRPGILKEFGLPAAIECQIEDFNQRTGIDCRVKCDDEWIDLNEKISLALFRILQEALTNVAKHAHASLVAIRLRRERNIVVLEIRDNGRGISETDMNKPKSFGLRGIRERVSSLNGEFIISQLEKGGSLLMLRIPVTNQQSTVPSIPVEESLQKKLF